MADTPRPIKKSFFYTGAGDAGTTSVYLASPDERRPPKSEPLFEAQGALDEAHVAVGQVFCHTGGETGKTDFPVPTITTGLDYIERPGPSPAEELQNMDGVNVDLSAELLAICSALLSAGATLTCAGSSVNALQSPFGRFEERADPGTSVSTSGGQEDGKDGENSDDSEDADQERHWKAFVRAVDFEPFAESLETLVDKFQHATEQVDPSAAHLTGFILRASRSPAAMAAHAACVAVRRAERALVAYIAQVWTKTVVTTFWLTEGGNPERALYPERYVFQPEITKDGIFPTDRVCQYRHLKVKVNFIEVLAYLNRLSDLFFALARYFDRHYERGHGSAAVSERQWNA